MTDKLNMLLSWYDAGYVSLIPWSNRTSAHRRPLITDWMKANITRVMVQEWCYRYPLADWAYVPKDGVVVLDLEMKNGLNGLSDLADLRLQYAPMTMWNVQLRIQSYSGGYHQYFQSRQSIVGGWHLRPGIEIKAETGSVHIPPSEGYRVESFCSRKDLPYLPEWLESLIQSERRVIKSRKRYDAPQYDEGQRRQHLCSMAAALRNIGLTEPELIASLRSIAATRCTTEFPVHEVDGIAKDYATKEVGTVGLALLGDPTARAAIAFCESRRNPK